MHKYKIVRDVRRGALGDVKGIYTKIGIAKELFKQELKILNGSSTRQNTKSRH